MPAVPFETNIPVGQFGSCTPTEYNPLKNMLDVISGGLYQLTTPPTFASNAYARVAAGTINFTWGSIFDSPVAGDTLCFGQAFGFESPEFMSWWYEGNGNNLVALALPVAGETVTINGVVYTWQAALAAPFDVKIGASVSASLDSLIKAINLTGVAGTDYFAGTTKHPTVSAAKTSPLSLEVVALVLGGAIVVADTMVNGSWSSGTGADVFATALASVGSDVICFPIPRFGESTGWYREAMTLKKFVDGKYSNGDQIKFRLFGDGAAIHLKAFPNVVLPAATPNVNFLADVQAGVFNSGEYSDALVDASPIGGLFPNWPAKSGSIVEALGGSPHLYMGSWHTPTRILCLWVNKAWYTAIGSPNQEWISTAAQAAAMKSMSQALALQDSYYKQMQSLGVVLHDRLPFDVLVRLRDAAGETYDALAVADATGNIARILSSMRSFIKTNQVRQRAMMDRSWRYQRYAYQADLVSDVRV